MARTQMARSLGLPALLPSETGRLAFLRRGFRSNGISILGSAIVFLVVLVALCAPLLAPDGYTEQDLAHRREPPSRTYPLGTDELGRSILDRLIWGARISILAGVVSVGVALLI